MISIIVPIYKVEKYLHQCINSIISQSFHDLEIILVDDGSPDNCPYICDDYANKDNRIKVIHKKNGGLIAARKSGVEVATGDYIAFVDGDDWIAPDMYEKVNQAIESCSPDGVFTQFYWSFSDKNNASEDAFLRNYYDKQQINDEIIPTMLFNGKYYRFGVYPNCWTKIFKADILKNNIFSVNDNIRMGEDAAFTYACIMDAESIAVIHQPLYFYRNTDESMSNAYDERLQDIWFLPYQAIKEKANKTNCPIQNQLDYYLLYLANFLLRNEASTRNNKTSSEKKRILQAIVNNDDVSSAASRIELSNLPIHTKLLAKALSLHSVPLIKAYILMLKKVIN